MSEVLRDLADLVTTVERMRAARPRASDRLIVGLAGAPGAGKSTVADALAAELPGSVVLPMDGFHLPQAELAQLRRRDRMGAPDTFDVDAFVALLERVRDLDKSGVSVLAPGFDRRVEEPVPDQIVLTLHARCVIVEGNYLLLHEHGWGRVAPLLDLTVGIVLDDATRHERLIARHIAFGKTPDAARAWALGPDERNAAAISSSLDRADYLLDASASGSIMGSSTR